MVATKWTDPKTGEVYHSVNGIVGAKRFYRGIVKGDQCKETAYELFKQFQRDMPFDIADNNYEEFFNSHFLVYEENEVSSKNSLEYQPRRGSLGFCWHEWDV